MLWVNSLITGQAKCFDSFVKTLWLACDIKAIVTPIPYTSATTDDRGLQLRCNSPISGNLTVLEARIPHSVRSGLNHHPWWLLLLEQ